MAFEPLTPLLEIGSEIIKRVWPNPEERDKAQLELLKLSQEGQFRDLETRISAIVTEAKSADAWTSRARPAFLYVIYIMILAAIPMGILSAFDQSMAQSIINGTQLWLSSIPKGLWELFGAGYLGYVGARSWEKKEIFKSKK